MAGPTRVERARGSEHAVKFRGSRRTLFARSGQDLDCPLTNATRRRGSRAACVPLVMAIVSATAGCASSHDVAERSSLPISFASAGTVMVRQCRDAARAVGYPVPCPMHLPRGLVGTPTGVPTRTGVISQPGCQPRFRIVGISPCTPLKGWQGWIVGSSEIKWPREHLVILASPRVIDDYAKFVNGPAWHEGERVEVGRWISSDGWRARWVYVPPRTNEGSAVAGHVMLIWTARGHTYGVGFHDTSTRAIARALDTELMNHMRLVRE